MIPTSRAAAIAENSPIYFTGKVCKNGHVAKRYTVSAACYHCLHPTISASPERQKKIVAKEYKAAERERRGARREVKSRLQVFRLAHLPPELREAFSAAVYAATMLRFPVIRPEDVSSVGALSWRCYPEDEPMLRKLSVDMLTAFYNTPERWAAIQAQQQARTRAILESHETQASHN